MNGWQVQQHNKSDLEKNIRESSVAYGELAGRTRVSLVVHVWLRKARQLQRTRECFGVRHVILQADRSEISISVTKSVIQLMRLVSTLLASAAAMTSSASGETKMLKERRALRSLALYRCIMRLIVCEQYEATQRGIMRLFRRRLSDTAPAPASLVASTDPSPDEGCAAEWQTVTAVPAMVLEDSCQKKGLATWGRRVGRKLEQLRRGDSRESLNSNSGEQTTQQRRRGWRLHGRGDSEPPPTLDDDEAPLERPRSGFFFRMGSTGSLNKLQQTKPLTSPNGCSTSQLATYVRGEDPADDLKVTVTTADSATTPEPGYVPLKTMSCDNISSLGAPAASTTRRAHFPYAFLRSKLSVLPEESNGTAGVAPRRRVRSQALPPGATETLAATDLRYCSRDVCTAVPYVSSNESGYDSDGTRGCGDRTEDVDSGIACNESSEDSGSLTDVNELQPQGSTRLILVDNTPRSRASLCEVQVRAPVTDWPRRGGSCRMPSAQRLSLSLQPLPPAEPPAPMAEVVSAGWERRSASGRLLPSPQATAVASRRQQFLASQLQPPASPVSARAELKLIRLERDGGTALGIHAAPRHPATPAAPYCVIKLDQGGVAQRDGRLRPGDELVSVNGATLRGLPVHETQRLLSAVGSTHVDIVVARPLTPLSPLPGPLSAPAYVAPPSPLTIPSNYAQPRQQQHQSNSVPSHNKDSSPYHTTQSPTNGYATPNSSYTNSYPSPNPKDISSYTYSSYHKDSTSNGYSTNNKSYPKESPSYPTNHNYAETVTSNGYPPSNVSCPSPSPIQKRLSTCSQKSTMSSPSPTSNTYSVTHNYPSNKEAVNGYPSTNVSCPSPSPIQSRLSTCPSPSPIQSRLSTCPSKPPSVSSPLPSPNANSYSVTHKETVNGYHSSNVSCPSPSPMQSRLSTCQAGSVSPSPASRYSSCPSGPASPSQNSRKCPSPSPSGGSTSGYSVLTVIFEKGPGRKSLGFSIVGGRDSPKGDIGVFVKTVFPDGQAAEDAKLQEGDEILAVNGCAVHGLSHNEAIALFKRVRCGELALRITRRNVRASPPKTSTGNGST
ncbi:hypothetical protein B566_EDAN001440 [Ephemera danica]|nr:hypothetical protein B566_EDAN001440 [Ephemera danica]